MAQRCAGNQLAMRRGDRAQQEDEAAVWDASEGFNCGLNFGGTVRRGCRDLNAHTRRDRADCAQGSHIDSLLGLGPADREGTTWLYETEVRTVMRRERFVTPITSQQTAVT